MEHTKGASVRDTGPEQDWRAFTARRLVAGAFGVAESDLMRRTRATADIAFARQVAMYLAHVIYQMTYNEVADAFGRERSTVAHACAVVEDARDDHAFEERIAKLEGRLQVLADLRRRERIALCGTLAVALEEHCPRSSAA